MVSLSRHHPADERPATSPVTGVTGDVEIHKLFKQLLGKLSREEFLKN